MNCVQINYNIMIFNCCQLIVVALFCLTVAGNFVLFYFRGEQLAGEHLIKQHKNLKGLSKIKPFN